MLGGVQNPPPRQPQPQPQLQQQQPQAGQDVPPPPLSGQDFTLSNVLHFLQSEWRKYERDRNEWEIERAEMRARIALLEGERRSFENVKVDLMRRIKMLEYALRMERTKQLTQPATSTSSQTNPGSTQSQSQKDDLAQKEDSNGGSSPRSEDSPLPPEPRTSNGLSTGGMRNSTWGVASTWSASSGQTSALAGLGKPPAGRDPKSRARSRDYLKQCLQEISYLTSPQAMNPLPSRPLSINNPSLSVSLPNVPSFDHIGYGARPRKHITELPGKDFALMNGANSVVPGTSSGVPSQMPGLDRGQQQPQQQQQLQTQQTTGGIQQQQQQQQPSPLPLQQQQSSTQSGVGSLQTFTGSQTGGAGVESERDKDPFPEGGQTTAIFRPDDKDEWRERLRRAHEAAIESGNSFSASWRTRDDDDDGKEEDDAEEDVSSVLGDGESTKAWKTKRTLRNHLDAVRALAFHPSELCLATGGDDCTVKIWRMDVNSLASSAARSITEVEPQLTLRGHTAAITRLVIAASRQLIYSASMDSTIRVWALPGASHTTYAPFNGSSIRGELIGHTDVVWDLALVRDENTLISCGAEGSVKVWDVNRPHGGALRLAWTYNGVPTDSNSTDESEDLPGACAVEAIKVDLKKVAVAFQNATIKLFDIVSGAELTTIKITPSAEGANSQVNSIASHPTMPLLVVGHEDKLISIFDITTGQCTHSMPAHLDGVTALSIDASGFSLVSAGHDCSVRFWDVLGSRACVQEITNHRKKADEGVLDVAFHPTLPFMASAGADGIVKLYASS